jgi:hypothetical protein
MAAQRRNSYAPHLDDEMPQGVLTGKLLCLLERSRAFLIDHGREDAWISSIAVTAYVCKRIGLNGQCPGQRDRQPMIYTDPLLIITLVNVYNRQVYLLAIGLLARV